MFRERQKKTPKPLKNVVLPWCELLELVGSWGSFWGGEIRKVLKLEGLRLGLVELEDEQEIPSWLL